MIIYLSFFYINICYHFRNSISQEDKKESISSILEGIYSILECNLYSNVLFLIYIDFCINGFLK